MTRRLGLRTLEYPLRDTALAVYRYEHLIISDRLSQAPTSSPGGEEPQMIGAPSLARVVLERRYDAVMGDVCRVLNAGMAGGHRPVVYTT